MSNGVYRVEQAKKQIKIRIEKIGKNQRFLNWFTTG